MSKFGWEYPPGVTGREPQIAGFPEMPLEVECGREITVLTVIGEPITIPGRTPVWLVHDDALEQVTCPFKGKIDGYVAWGDWSGECPICEQEIVVELEVGDVP